MAKPLFSPGRTCGAEHHNNHKPTTAEKDLVYCDRHEGHPVNAREQHTGIFQGTRIYWR